MRFIHIGILFLVLGVMVTRPAHAAEIQRAQFPTIYQQMTEMLNITHIALAEDAPVQPIARMETPVTFTINASAYTAAADECGKSDGITASGAKVTAYRTLACPPSYTFGTKIHIVGMGDYICEDRGGAIKGNKFDIYMETKKEAFAFGRRQLEAYVVL